MFGIMEDTEGVPNIGEKFILIGQFNGDCRVGIPRDVFGSVGFISWQVREEEGEELDYVSVSNSLGGFSYSTWNVKGFPMAHDDACSLREKNQLPPIDSRQALGSAWPS